MPASFHCLNHDSPFSPTPFSRPYYPALTVCWSKPLRGILCIRCLRNRQKEAPVPRSRDFHARQAVPLSFPLYHLEASLCIRPSAVYRCNIRSTKSVKRITRSRCTIDTII